MIGAAPGVVLRDVVSWNVDGLARWLTPGADAALGRALVGFGEPDVLCLQEIRLRPGDRRELETMIALAAAAGYRCHVALCDDARNVRFRGGRAYGVVTFVHERLGAAHAEPLAADREGRVVISHLPDLGLAVGNVYLVNGTDRPYLDPASGRPDGDRHAYKRRLQDRLFARVAEMAAELVIAGDWNVSRTRLDVHPRLRTAPPHAQARLELERHLAASGLIDVHRALHPEGRDFSWRHRGARFDAARVDFVLVSPTLAARVVRADIVDPPPGLPSSDHRPVIVRLADQPPTTLPPVTGKITPVM